MVLFRKNGERLNEEIKKQKEAETDSLEFEGGTLEGLEYRLSLAETTKNRCYELVEVYMK